MNFSSKTISYHLDREYSPGKLSGFLPLVRMSLACVQTPPPPPLTDVSLPIFSEGRGASVLRLVCSLPLARVEGVEKGRVREEGEKAGGLGTSPLLSSSMAWGGGAGLRASSLWPDRAPQRACSQAKWGKPWDRANHRYVPLGWKNEFERRGVQERLRGRHGL